MEKNHTHLSLEERRKIFLLVNSKTPVKRIAEQLCRHHSTIYRELARNTTYHEDPYLRGYFHMNADYFMRQRRQRLRRLYRLPALKDYVTDRLRAYWSPEQIAGHMKRQDGMKFYACAETIYQHVYSDEGRDSGLYRYLFRGRPKRRRQYSRKPHDRVPAHHGIAWRPEIVNSRATFGHWEGDLMIFDRIHGKVNLTSLIERRSRYTILAKNDNRKPVPVISTIRDRLKKLPSQWRQTITFDRGFEFMSYPLLRRDLGMASYFCDPQAPWQKGAVESNNNRIRRFLPRETNLATLSDADLYEVCVIMNNTPRKCLGFRTPQEVLDEHLHDQAMVIK
jgi:IS30 family transposase